MSQLDRAIEVITELSGDSLPRIVAIAEMLDEAGLLAPAALREEWGTRFGDYVMEGRTDAHYPFFFKGEPPKGENVRRLVSEWSPANE